MSGMLKILLGSVLLLGQVGCAVKHKREAEAEKIIEAYRAQKEDVKNCYYKALEAQPDLSGEITLEWIVNGKGELKKAWIKSSSIEDPEMKQCILTHLKTVNFPKTQNLAKITVEYTLSFTR